MERCFVIQPFDKGQFDDRYDEVLAPAIAAAGLEPYRVDRDPKVTIPIQEIENQIRGSRICVADITLDNPNIWFELGFAIAANKDVVPICSEARQSRFPFDVQHRSIIQYRTTSPKDFERLRQAITERLKALLEKEQTLSDAVDSKLHSIEGLNQIEVVALAAVGGNIYSTSDKATSASVRQDMQRSGFLPFAAAIALKSLVNRKFLTEEMVDSRDYDGQYAVYGFTELGWKWIMANQSEFSLSAGRKSTLPSNAAAFSDDDIPF